MKELSLAVLGLVISWFSFKYIWINQAKFKEKIKTLNDAAKALALFEWDVFIQPAEKKVNSKGWSRKFELDKETDIIKSEVLFRTKALYGKRAYECLDYAFRCVIDTDPTGDDHEKFLEQCKNTSEEMARDIQASMSLIKYIKMQLQNIFCHRAQGV